MDKIDRLLDAIEHPDRYTDAEIDALLADTEVKETCDLLDKIQTSLQPVGTPDVEAEWKSFSNTHIPGTLRFMISRFFSRNVAAATTIAIASLAAVAAVVGIGVSQHVADRHTPDNGTADALSVSVNAPTDTVTVDAEDVDTPTPGVIIFNNEPLDTIVGHIAAYYGYTVEFAANAPRSLRLYFRWNRGLTIDQVIGSLNNFEQIHLTVNGRNIKID